jgi:predicted RNA binding protein YcfA (HicA-like mRNA interferase family)
MRLTLPGDADTMEMKVRDVIRLLEVDGWVLVRQRGSHRQFKHAIKPGTVTVAGTTIMTCRVARFEVS